MLSQLAAIWLVAASATGVPIDLLPGQSPSRPPVGQRVRVHLTTGERRVGNVAGWLPDTLRLRRLVYRGSPDSLLYIPRADITSYQSSRGRDELEGARRGARAGVLVGGGIGLVLLGLGLYSDAHCEDICLGTIVGGMLGVGTTLAGVVVGATIGVAAAPEQWSEPRAMASSDGRSHSRRLALGLSISR